MGGVICARYARANTRLPRWSGQSLKRSGRVACPGASDASEATTGMLDVLRLKLDAEVIAAGECGADKNRSRS